MLLTLIFEPSASCAVLSLVLKKKKKIHKISGFLYNYLCRNRYNFDESLKRLFRTIELEYLALLNFPFLKTNWMKTNEYLHTFCSKNFSSEFHLNVNNCIFISHLSDQLETINNKFLASKFCVLKFRSSVYLYRHLLNSF